MQRLVNPGKRLPDKAGEPDFYEISRKYPLPPAPTTAPDDLPEAPHQAQRPGQQGRFNIQAAQAGGYPYGYYQAAPPYPQLPSPATSFAQPFPPQPLQQAYWPNQLAPSLYPPNPTAYGYYPYPQMMVPQGYEQYPHASMYGQYFPPGAPTAYAPSPGRPKPELQAQQQQQQQVDDPEQFYQAGPGTHDSPTDSDADADEDRKPPAQPNPAGGQPLLSTVPRDTEGADSQPLAAETNARDGAYDSAQQQLGASRNVIKEEPNTSTERRAQSSSKPEEGGDGINEQQLLQDFFQHF